MRLKASILFGLIVSAFTASAQPLPPPPPNMAVPLDTVVAVLLLAGIAFGVYRLRNKNKKTVSA